MLIFYSGQWGTICNDSWDISDAQVVCRQLGYKDGLTTFGGGNVFRGSRKVWLDDANCTGSEQSLTSCLHSGWGNHNCSSSVGVGVECSLTGKFTVQLNTLYIFHAVCQPRSSTATTDCTLNVQRDNVYIVFIHVLWINEEELNS